MLIEISSTFLRNDKGSFLSIEFKFNSAEIFDRGNPRGKIFGMDRQIYSRKKEKKDITSDAYINFLVSNLRNII